MLSSRNSIEHICWRRND